MLIHVATNNQYGYFRDGRYFLACGAHLDRDYADHAQIIGWISRFGRTFCGDSLPAIRFFPALAAAVVVPLIGLLAIELGGRRFAVLLACLSTLVAPSSLTVGNVLMIDSFEPIWWTACVYFLVLAIKRGELNEPNAMAEEHQTIYQYRGLSTSLGQLWPELRVWN